MVRGRDPENVTQGQGGQGLTGVQEEWEMGEIEKTVLNECLAVSNCHFSFRIPFK